MTIPRMHVPPTKREDMVVPVEVHEARGQVLVGAVNQHVKGYIEARANLSDRPVRQEHVHVGAHPI